MDALDVIIENQGWAPDATLGLLRRFINGRGLNAECAQFLQSIADAEKMERRLPIFQWTPGQRTGSAPER